MSESQSFLSRWAKRKQQAREAERAPAPQPATAPDSAEVLASGGTDPQPELSAEEIASLPPIEAITAQTDIRQFLRKGVPQALRLAALRKMWALDPTIRDYVGDARDYAWDWNVPDGVPGTGPLLQGEDTKSLADRLLDRTPRQAAESRAPEGESPAAEERETSEPRTAGVPSEGQAEGAEMKAPPDRLTPPASQPHAVAAGEGTTETSVAVRRHGRARPV